jgi:hypothetical protein
MNGTYSFFSVVSTIKKYGYFKVRIKEHDKNEIHLRNAYKASTKENSNDYIFKYNCKNWNIKIN